MSTYPGYLNNGFGLFNNLELATPGYNSVGIGLGNSALLGAGYGLGVVGPAYGAGLVGYPDLIGYPNLGAIGTSGPLAVSTISPIGPSGLAVASENEIAGTVLASGTLPFLSAVAFEGALPTAGSGVATCGCGNGAVGILSEGFPGPIGGCGCGASAIYPGPYYGRGAVYV